ncbi:MAG: heavy metal transporter [Epsilonproteobacteria bacterium]|nr:MAG: heavy metal transporter [Campylobacterota bacterium]
MLQTFQVENIKCSGCANTVKTKLKEQFDVIEVDLEKTPREITLDIEDKDIDTLKLRMKSLGYPFCSETLNTIDTFSTKAKSFVSCAIGKMDAKN